MKNYYRITAYGCSMYGAVDSAFVVFCAVYGTFVQFIPWQYAAALGIAGVGLIAMAIDYGLMVGLQTFFGRYYDGVTGTHKRLIMGWSLLFLLIQVFGTMGLTMYGRKYVTDAVTTPPKMEQADMSEPNRYADLVKEQREQLERLKSAERKELAAAVVNPQLAEMAKDGNNWAATEVNKKRKAITDKYAAQRGTIEAGIAANLQLQAEATGRAGRLKADKYNTDFQRYETSTATLNGLQLWLSLAATCLLILSSLMYALEEVYAKGQAQTPDKEVYRGVHRSPFGMFTRPVFTAAETKAAQMQEQQAARAQALNAERRRPIAPNATVNVQGFDRRNIENATRPVTATPPRPVAVGEQHPNRSAATVAATVAPTEVVWEGQEARATTPRLLPIATLGISKAYIPQADPSKVMYVVNTAEGDTAEMYNIGAFKKQLRTYWSDLEKHNSGQPSRRNIATVVKNIERMEAVLHAAGIPSESKKRLQKA